MVRALLIRYLYLVQANDVSTDCTGLPTSDSGWTAAHTAQVDACGGDLINIVAGSPDGNDLGLKLTQMTAAYSGLAALRQLQQDALTSSTAVGGLRQLYNNLIT